jgi:N-acetylmuramoyl-L-alanine amidase
MKICIDPGHSGPFEPGACAGGVTEAALNMAIARFAAEELKLCGHEVRFTRDGSIDDDELNWRATLANDWGADLYLCIHCNSAVRVEAEGTETYHYPGSIAGEQLARCIQFRITDALLTEDRGVKAADFQVLRETVCPAVLVECGFISNPIDRGMLTDPLEQWRLGAAIAVAVDDWRKKVKEN